MRWMKYRKRLGTPPAGVGKGDCYYEEESIQPQCLSSICFCLKDILNTNDKSEPIPHLENSVRIIIDWSEWRDLNSRPLDPQSSALPTALHPVLFSCGFLKPLCYYNTLHFKMQDLILHFTKNNGSGHTRSIRAAEKDQDFSKRDLTNMKTFV